MIFVLKIVGLNSAGVQYPLYLFDVEVRQADCFRAASDHLLFHCLQTLKPLNMIEEQLFPSDGAEDEIELNFTNHGESVGFSPAARGNERKKYAKRRTIIPPE